MKFLKLNLFDRLPASAKHWSAAICAAILAGCGGGGGGGGSESNSTAQAQDAEATAYAQMMSVAPSANDARRFLTQATFGPTDASATTVQQQGYRGWVDAQLALPANAGQHLTFFNARMAELRATNPTASRDSNFVIFSNWNSYLNNNDQLRQRMAFALSQIFVVSLADDCLNFQPQAVASYADMLTSQAFGSYRSLLESVARHPAMGCYLSHLKNRKEDLTTGRQPDENFAREVMQLFSIGLHRLNTDGTPVRDGNGALIETYTSDDVKGLAKVFTGLSFNCTAFNSNCFWRGIDSSSAAAPDSIWTQPMRFYPAEHSTSEKRFLGVTIPAGASNPDDSLRTALDTLANHPNVAPFISRQLIQRLVTSNPSPAYVQRVATTFKNSNGNLGEVAKAILLDREARVANYTSASSGKLREPVLRLTALYRVTGAASQTGHFQISRWMQATAHLGQVPYLSPSVFNFYRPGYVPPGTDIATQGLVAPEFQQLDESTLASYANFMQVALDAGSGNYVPYPDSTTKPDVRPLYLSQTDTPLLVAAANSNAALVDHINERLMYGTMSEALRNTMLEELARITVSPTATPTQVLDAQRRKVRFALLLAAVSPDFLIQR